MGGQRKPTIGQVCTADKIGCSGRRDSWTSVGLVYREVLLFLRFFCACPLGPAFLILAPSVIRIVGLVGWRTSVMSASSV
jgi:hypothetical protein